MSTSTESTTEPRALSAAERLARKREGAPPKHDDGPEMSFLQRARGLVDALAFAFVLAMFIRSFVFELFMIPTGSMTPTLIGDSAGDVALLDYDGDGIEDVVYTFFVPNQGFNDFVQVYLMNEDGSYKDQIFVANVASNILMDLKRSTKQRKDMIIVSKFAYWFRTPDRGEISVFKVPHRPNPRDPSAGITFDHTKPVYIKRVVGLPGETISFLPVSNMQYPPRHASRYGDRLGGVEIHLERQPMLVNGEPVQDDRFDSLVHYPRPNGRIPLPTDAVNTIPVQDDSVLMVGDNSASSSDGRYWGTVPVNQLRGRAILRYAPWYSRGFLH